MAVVASLSGQTRYRAVNIASLRGQVKMIPADGEKLESRPRDSLTNPLTKQHIIDWTMLFARFRFQSSPQPTNIQGIR